MLKLRLYLIEKNTLFLKHMAEGTGASQSAAAMKVADFVEEIDTVGYNSCVDSL